MQRFLTILVLAFAIILTAGFTCVSSLSLIHI